MGLYSPALPGIQGALLGAGLGCCQRSLGAALSCRGRARARVPFMNVATKSEVELAAEGGRQAALRSVERRRSIRPLLGLIPFVARYQGRAVAALVALIVAAVATLAVPIAVRRMIDNGFDPTRVGLIDEYFGVMVLVAAILAGASAMRYYLVTTIGERVVADLRDAVFERITILSASFFDTANTRDL